MMTSYWYPGWYQNSTNRLQCNFDTRFWIVYKIQLCRETTHPFSIYNVRRVDLPLKSMISYFVSRTRHPTRPRQDQEHFYVVLVSSWSQLTFVLVLVSSWSQGLETKTRPPTKTRLEVGGCCGVELTWLHDCELRQFWVSWLYHTTYLIYPLLSTGITVSAVLIG